jgi:hypothetical protein
MMRALEAYGEKEEAAALERIRKAGYEKKKKKGMFG